MYPTDCHMCNSGMSQTFDNYCISIGICIEHLVTHIHTQNGLAKSFLKRFVINY